MSWDNQSHFTTSRDSWDRALMPAIITLYERQEAIASWYKLGGFNPSVSKPTAEEVCHVQPHPWWFGAGLSSHAVLSSLQAGLGKPVPGKAVDP